MPDSPLSDAFYREIRRRLSPWRLTNLCTRFLGHWLVNVEEGVARCRICRSIIFCSHASDDAFYRILGGHSATCSWWSSNPSHCNCGSQNHA